MIAQWNSLKKHLQLRLVCLQTDKITLPFIPDIPGLNGQAVVCRKMGAIAAVKSELVQFFVNEKGKVKGKDFDGNDVDEYLFSKNEATLLSRAAWGP